MSRLAILAPFLLLSGIVVAKVDVPTVDCGPTLSWTSNSIGQNPCVVAAHLMATCSGGSFSMPPLQQNNSYYGPARDDDSDAKDLCKCNTVVYSLLSACDACQQQEWIAWSRYSSNCTTIAPVSSFPYRIPSGTYVPYWALFDVTVCRSIFFFSTYVYQQYIPARRQLEYHHVVRHRRLP
ncbi:hypothetical protein BJV78DRAFT_1254372 [Lactifluus subvellereus]|nr:hypothetical protein BJV78DRAFT_1254372 [Lactifluus subvellereus]